MLRIRLSRRGKKGQPSYRVVVTDVNNKRDGRIVERIGNYYPLTDPASHNIQEDRALHWLSVGAQPSDAVKRLLEKQGTYDRLARLHKGESLEALVAEYEGVELPTEAGIVETVVEKAEAAVSAVTAVASDIVEEITAVITDEEE